MPLRLAKIKKHLEFGFKIPSSSERSQGWGEKVILEHLVPEMSKCSENDGDA